MMLLSGSKQRSIIHDCKCTKEHIYRGSVAPLCFLFLCEVSNPCFLICCFTFNAMARYLLYLLIQKGQKQIM